MVIKLPFTATLKGHVQILNSLLEWVSEKFERTFFSPNLSARITHNDLENFDVF